MKYKLLYKLKIKKNLINILKTLKLLKKTKSLKNKYLISNYSKLKKYCIIQHKHKSIQSFVKLNRFSFKKMCYTGYLFGFLKK